MLKPIGIIGGSHHVIRMCSAPTSLSSGLDLSSVTFAAPLGASVAHDTADLLRRHFPNMKHCLNLYGQTEAGNIVSYSLDPRHIGYVAPGSEIKIADPDTGEALGPDRSGEIMVRTACIMKGYLNRPEENEAYFGKDGFTHTGDVGHYDKEGRLYFDSRVKDMIKYQNVHIHPAEVEEVIRGHPSVENVGVFGVSHPEDQEYVAAAIVLKRGEKAAAEDIKKLVEESMEKQKWLRGGVHFVDELPYNPMGKLQRKEIQKMLQAKK